MQTRPLIWWRRLLLAAVLVIVSVTSLALAPGTASAAALPVAERRVRSSTITDLPIVRAAQPITASQHQVNSPPKAGTVVGSCVAARGADIGGAKFAQTSFSEAFSKGGTFAGRTIDDVAGDLRSGVLTPKGVPIDVIVGDGNTLILNTRSSQALTRAGVPRSRWNVVDRTGQAEFEARLTDQLTNNKLTSAGTDLP